MEIVFGIERPTFRYTFIYTKVEKRHHFQQELATARAKEGNLKVSKEIERMQCTEQQRLSAKRIRRMNGSERSTKGLTKVVVPGDDGDDIELVEKVAMEEALLEAYETTLTQANKTPCMVSPLKERLGLCRTGDLADALIHGDHSNLDGVDGATQEV